MVKALPEIAGKATPGARRAMERHVYRVSRAILGHELADQLQFPRYHTAGLLPALRCMRRTLRATERVMPGLARKLRVNSFIFLLERSTLLDMSYLIPDKLKAKDTSPW